MQLIRAVKVLVKQGWRGVGGPSRWCGRLCLVFFFSSRRRHTRSDRDWSSDVCSSDLVARYAAACFERSSYTHSVAFFSSYMKYSAIAQPEKGAMYCIGAGSEADASTTMVYSIASNSLSFSTTAATVEPFCPIATYTQITPVPF